MWQGSSLLGLLTQFEKAYGIEFKWRVLRKPTFDHIATLIKELEAMQLQDSMAANETLLNGKLLNGQKFRKVPKGDVSHEHVH